MRRGSLFIAFVVGMLVPAAAELPQIQSLSHNDVVFSQLQQDIDSYYRAQGNDQPLPPLRVFRYQASETDTLFSVSARANVPYEAIATLNRLPSPKALRDGMWLRIPNLPGVFVPAKPRSDLEHLMRAWRSESDEASRRIALADAGIREEYDFFPGSRFHPVERSFFLHVMFRFPLADGMVTSGYGSRLNPFTGRRTFHRGIDVRPGADSHVLAARAGRVVGYDVDRVFGRRVTIAHEGGFQTVYAHLAEVYVAPGDSVRSGSVIATVGSSGLSTGPHLHFEIRREGQSRDPSALILRSGM
jgi:murein DD-endopeptidase MepM/ murein hydrolase activator NlpD